MTTAEDLPATKRVFRFTHSGAHLCAAATSVAAVVVLGMGVGGLQVLAGATAGLAWPVLLLVGTAAGAGYLYVFDRLVITEDGLELWRLFRRIRILRQDVREIDHEKRSSAAVVVAVVPGHRRILAATDRKTVPWRLLLTLNLVHDYPLSDHARALTGGKRQRGADTGSDDLWSTPLLRTIQTLLALFFLTAGSLLGVALVHALFSSLGWT